MYSLVVISQPALTNGAFLQNWVKVDLSTYHTIYSSTKLFVNVVQPLTKEYILPLPGQSGPNHHHCKQV